MTLTLNQHHVNEFSFPCTLKLTYKIYHITTGAKHLPMSFQTYSNNILKILLSILVFWISRNRYFAQKEGLRKRKSEEVCCFAKGRFFFYIRNIISYYYRC